MTKGHNPAVLHIHLLDMNQAVSMFIALCCCFGGFGVLAAVKEITNVAAHIEVVLLMSGCILVISGIYHTSTVVNQISDPYLFYFYNKMNINKVNTLSEDLSIFMVASTALLLSALIWTFMYSTGFNDSLFAAFATSALIPLLAMSIRIRKRLNLYRMVSNSEDEHLEDQQSEMEKEVAQ